MINGKSVIAIIPARGGSKGLPRKNILALGGKPLIAWAIEAAQASQYLDRVILSSDDDEIISVAASFGCEVPFKRHLSLAADDTPSSEVVIDALERCSGYDLVVLLQPTSPLRTAEDIDKTIEQCEVLNAPACVTVCETDQSPYWMFTLEREAYLLPIVQRSLLTRRQDLPSTYILNGAVYVARTDWFLKERTFISTTTVAYIMPASRSVDIDTEEDFHQVQTSL